MNGCSICVVTMDRGEKLQQTLDAILRYSTHPYELIVVDNGSTEPRSLEVLNWIQNTATVIRNETNLGLSVATNQGLEAGQYDCLIHLDDDCLVQTIGWNNMMRNYFSIPEIGMIVPGRMGEAIKHDRYYELRWALGMCWAIRKELFDDIGGYDPQLYHQNECDMALRVRMAGYHLAGIEDFQAVHNDLGGERSEASLAREHLGCVQFRDKWSSYFRGREWDYGTDPIYLMQHWPPDQEFLRRWALSHGVNLNPARDLIGDDPSQYWDQLDEFAKQQLIDIDGGKYLIYRELRNDYAHWEWVYNPDVYKRDREVAIARWERLTGEHYDGYKWPYNLLRPY